MKKIITLLPYLILTACHNPTAPQAGQPVSNDLHFESYKTRFVEALWKLYPGWASSQGYHRYDSVLVVPGLQQREKELAFDRSNLDSLKQIGVNGLNDNNKTDFYMLRDYLESNSWGIQSLRSYEWDPSNYNVCGSFAEMLGNNYDSLDTRLHNFYIKMAPVKAYYAAAKQNIKNPTEEHRLMAIEQNLGGISVFESDLAAALKQSHLSAAEKTSMKQRAAETVMAIKDYADWLKNFKAEQPRSFRLGKALYLQKFDFEIQSRYTAGQVFEKALKHKDELHAQMFEITQKLWPKYFKSGAMPADKLAAIRQLINIISLNHVKADSFQTAIAQQIPMLTAFVEKKKLITLDASKPLVVRKEPAYMAGLAGASISSPGPYDKNGNTYYNVGSLSGWDKQRAESYLREYNHYILQILNIHEAIPGHYTQLIYSNRSPSIIKSILGSGSMVEGWAVYAERMMLENGYGARQGSHEAEPEMWLMYYKWNLRSTCNTILDYSVHAKNMSKEQALNLLMNEAFQQQAEAEGKWHRVSISQVQLCCYFTGYTEIYDFREELKKKMGNSFDLQKFHEKFLSYGSAPVKYIRELMLAEAEKK